MAAKERATAFAMKLKCKFNQLIYSMGGTAGSIKPAICYAEKQIKG
jgi:hypothetical protein